VAVAAASSDSVTLWQIGIDVLAGYEGQGLGKYLVSELTKAILKKNIVPYYGTWSANIASRRLALACGYVPFWTEIF